MKHIDCQSGISGDMFVGALLDMGADVRKIRRILKPIARVGLKRVRRRGVAAIKFTADFKPKTGEYYKLVGVVKGLKLSGEARRIALRILLILAKAESKVHGVPLRRVHLHEAVDCVVDAVAAAVALDELGLADGDFTSSVVSCGYIAPATKEILMEYGIPVKFVSDRELVTPTGAAILAALVSDWGEMGYEGAAAGAGSMELPWPNVLRIGDVKPKVVLESNVDDCTPEHISHMMSSLMEAGALDVHVLPCAMKKGRLGFLVRVLTGDPEGHAKIIMDETKTLGVRVLPVDYRYELPRKMRRVEVRFGGSAEMVRVKCSPLGVKPEYDDIARISRRHGMTFREARERIVWGLEGQRIS